MKSFWPYFVMGAFIVFLVGIGVNVASGQKTDDVPEESSEAKPVNVDELAVELQDKEKSIIERERVLKDWEDRLNVQEARIKSRIEELKTLSDENKKLSEEMQKRQETVEKNLVKTFETMNPKKAAEVLTVMETPLAVELLMAMKSKIVATILDKMDANKAMILSSEIAQRNPAGAM